MGDGYTGASAWTSHQPFQPSPGESSRTRDLYPFHYFAGSSSWNQAGNEETGAPARAATGGIDQPGFTNKGYWSLISIEQTVRTISTHVRKSNSSDGCKPSVLACTRLLGLENNVSSVPTAQGALHPMYGATYDWEA